MAFHLEGCTIEDATELAQNNGTACWEQYMWRTIRPQDKSKEFILENLEKVFPMRLISDRDTTRHVKAVDTASGKIVGYIRWTFPDGFLNQQLSDDLKWLSAKVPDVGDQGRKQFQELRDSAWWEIRQDQAPLHKVNQDEMNRILGDMQYVELDLLAVNRDYRGKGIATALVQDGIQHIAQLNIPIFIQAWQEALGIYQRCGFKEVGQSIQDDTLYGGQGQFGVYFLLYPA